MTHHYLFILLLFFHQLLLSSSKSIPGFNITPKEYQELLNAEPSPSKRYALNYILEQQKENANAAFKFLPGKSAPSDEDIIDLTRVPAVQTLSANKNVPPSH